MTALETLIIGTFTGYIIGRYGPFLYRWAWCKWLDRQRCEICTKRGARMLREALERDNEGEDWKG